MSSSNPKLIYSLSESISCLRVSKDSENKKELPNGNSDHRHPVQVPQDVVLEILARLPAKSLMRFMCVCKSWYSTIRDDPHFAELARNNSLTLPDGKGCFMTLWCHPIVLKSFRLNEPYVLSVSCTDDQGQILQGPMQFTMDREIPKRFSRFSLWEVNNYISASRPFDGLVCIYSADYYDASVLNISTGQVVSLPFVLNISTRQIVSLPNTCFPRKSAECTYYLCFDPVKKEYKVLNIIDHSGGRETLCEIYTLGTPSRRILTISPGQALKSSFSCSVNGVIYWTNVGYHDEDGYNPIRYSLIVCDVGKEVFHFHRISEPIDLRMKHTLAVVEGKLLLLKQFGYMDKRRGFEVWLLDPDNDQNLFLVREKFDIVHPLLGRYGQIRDPLSVAFISPIGISPMGELVTTDGDHSRRLYYLDWKRKTLRIESFTPSCPEKYGLPVDDTCRTSYIYTENLVRLRDCGSDADHGNNSLKLA